MSCDCTVRCSNLVVVGSPLRCELRPRHEGLPTRAVASAFRLDPVLKWQRVVSLQIHPPAVHADGSDHQPRSAYQEPLQNAISFTASASESTSTHEHLFSAAVLRSNTEDSSDRSSRSNTQGDDMNGDGDGGDSGMTEVQLLVSPVVLVAPRWEPQAVQASVCVLCVRVCVQCVQCVQCMCVCFSGAAQRDLTLCAFVVFSRCFTSGCVCCSDGISPSRVAAIRVQTVCMQAT